MDPLTAVVILAIAGAGGLVSLLQMDQDSNRSVDVPMNAFVAGELPAVCCKTGEPADVVVPVLRRRLFRQRLDGAVPITKARYLEFLGWRNINRTSWWAFWPLALIGAALDLAADSIVVSWAAGLSVLAVFYVMVYSKAKALRLLVRPQRNLDGTVMLRGVHPLFVDAVRAARRSTA